jgi:glycosyltransferase involved in cell wall biosynthesis
MDLRSSGSLPLELVSSPADWINRVTSLWQNAAQRAELGSAAREWVREYYSWEAPARKALAAFEYGRRKR